MVQAARATASGNGPPASNPCIGASKGNLAGREVDAFARRQRTARKHSATDVLFSGANDRAT
jgi:hypothetical protein